MNLKWTKKLKKMFTYLDNLFETNARGGLQAVDWWLQSTVFSLQVTKNYRNPVPSILNLSYSFSFSEMPRLAAQPII
jgi:hypothetical protein